jgi:hypothetical protein
MSCKSFITKFIETIVYIFTSHRNILNECCSFVSGLIYSDVIGWSIINNELISSSKFLFAIHLIDGLKQAAEKRT